MMQELENMSFEDRLENLEKFGMFNLTDSEREMGQSWFRHLIGCHWEVRNYFPLSEEPRSEIMNRSGSYLDFT